MEQKISKNPNEEIRQDPLEILGIIKRLEVGPPQIESRRIVAPYKITQNDGSASFDLIYRYQEKVFDPDDPSIRNLAAMILSQVALNYGLFCQEIIFHGIFDKADHQFIKDMIENTAREIYVKKFLETNPFLLGEAARMPVVKRNAYSRAKISFQPDTLSPSKKQSSKKEPPAWNSHVSKHAVLSSGGKDSLLSFGLLNEMKQEVHPIFINESGRHWFTALNGYRHLSSRFPQTTKVWTNADRLFSWMLRHFPFVRQDFARIRSDEYPIRLWTVAVFLFGALPVLKKRGIGRLIIGDEHDTTARSSFQGITHYNGLFDQSRYFDHALTRYFIRKNWNIQQFSILRPLSELLIEQILVKRYPDLQRQQMSCHATHIKKNRVYPCGRCEKCRRIVGMLLSIGASPENCGYSPKQIEYCLDELARKGVQQESAGVSHLFFLLRQKNLLPKSFKAQKAKNHPEILKLRIDPEKSPLEAIPVDLRKPLLKILLKHADGAVRRLGKLWVDFDPFNDPSISNPYPFDHPENQQQPSSSSRYLWGELTWPEAQQYFKKVDVALLPVGSIEQHGPHLPLDTDAFDAFHLAREVASACEDPKPLVFPLISYGVSYHHADFSGTISISPRTLSRLVYEVGMSAARNGMTKLIIINGHGGNIPALQYAAQMINRDAHIFTCVETGETSEKDITELIETPNDVHAGEVETSTALAIRPPLVRKDKMSKFVPRFSSSYLNFTSKRSVEWYARIAKISQKGVLGDPTKASPEKGRKIWKLMIRHLVEFVEDLKSMSLDEIYQKRY